ncbi:MAG: hypothetical protein ACRCWI_08580 [Brevinema sp.]
MNFFRYSYLIFALITFGGCSFLATSLQNSTLDLTEWDGYYAPKNPSETDFLRDYYKIESNYIKIKHITFNLETGNPVVQGGSVYYIKEFIKQDANGFQAWVQNSIAETDRALFFSMQKELDCIRLIAPSLIEDISDEVLINKSSAYIYSLDNPIIEPITPPIIDPDPDPDPNIDHFLNKITNNKEYEFWNLTATANDQSKGLLKLIGMSAKSKVVIFKESLKDKSGQETLYKGSAIYGYAYKDKDPIKKPSYPLHYTPKNDKYGIYWFKGNWVVGNKDVYLPIMIYQDYIFGGQVKMNGATVTETDWEFFDVPISCLLQYNNILIRSNK